MIAPDDVRAARKKMGWSQAELAEALGMTGPSGRNTVRAWEGGKREITGPAAYALMAYVTGWTAPDPASWADLIKD